MSQVAKKREKNYPQGVGTHIEATIKFYVLLKTAIWNEKNALAVWPRNDQMSI